jgi:hypothetical protein
MASSDQPTSKRTSLVIPIVAALALVAVAIGGLYLGRPAPKSAPKGASPAAQSYLANLRLSDVQLQASENFMNQQVVEVQGRIANNGTKTIRKMEIYCIFQGLDGRELHRELVPIIGGAGNGPLRPHTTQPFRLPFDKVPDGWNQAVPGLVIASIDFTA